jgi:hypothetical protein
MNRFQRFKVSCCRERESVERQRVGEPPHQGMDAAEGRPLGFSSPGEVSGAHELPGEARRQQIITSYLETLERLKSPIRSKSELPFAKHDIQRAIVEELLENPESDVRSCLEVAYAEIESFIPVEEYELLQRFKETFTLAEELAAGGAPKDIVASSRLVERISGEKAVGVLERISFAMRRQFRSIRSIGMIKSSVGFGNAFPS